MDLLKKTWLDDDTRKDLRWKKLCFTCQEPWVLGHRCSGKAKAHYIEVYSNSEGEDYKQETTEELRAAEESLRGDTPEGVIATLSGVPRFHTLRVRGIVRRGALQAGNNRGIAGSRGGVTPRGYTRGSYCYIIQSTSVSYSQGQRNSTGP